MRKPSAWRRFMMGLCVLSGGTLLQTSCSEAAADVTTGLVSSVTTQFIRSVVYDYFNVGSAATLGR